MEWDEINRRLKNGASVQVLADLDGVPYKTMYNRIKYYERRDGKKYMPDNSKKPKEDKRKTDPGKIKSFNCTTGELIYEEDPKPTDPRPISPELIPPCANVFLCQTDPEECNEKCLGYCPDGPERPEGVKVPVMVYEEVKEKIDCMNSYIEELQKERDGWARILAAIEKEGEA